jgi:hypothetical protein
MSSTDWMFGSLVVALLAASPAAAQDRPERQVIVYGRGGGYNALTNLNDAGTADTKTGYNVGGGVGVQIQRYVVIRGDFTYARDQFRNDGVETGVHLNKYFYGGALQLQYPSAAGFTPYVLAGGGAVTIDQQGGGSKTKGQGTFGAGFSYTIPRTNWAFFGEGLGYVFKVENFGGVLAGFDKTQFDVAWSGGISYAIPF